MRWFEEPDNEVQSLGVAPNRLDTSLDKYVVYISA